MSSADRPRPLSTEVPFAGGEDFDIEDYEVDDPFRDNYIVPKSKANEADYKAKDGLGIDEEVEVTRKPRAPRVKLDENRLLSDAGIPKLRMKARNHLKFRGKGHEYSDASRLLAFYQLWLDDLFPKARFLDALAMAEKMGHKKRMQSMRMEWINKGRPHSSVHEESIFDDPVVSSGERGMTASRAAPIFEKAGVMRPKTPEANRDVNMHNDLYDATPRPARRQTQADSQDSLFGGANSIFGPSKIAGADNGIADDDMDALLAEAEMSQRKVTASAPKSNASQQVNNNGFDDDLDALLAEEELIQATKPKQQPTNSFGNNPDEFDNDMEAMEAMTEMDQL